ncbi:MAG: hypothetical protein AB7I50_20115 [Vicinamibacterales bacterium]
MMLRKAGICITWLVGFAALVGTARAEVTRVGDSMFVSAGNTTTRYPDVDFDTTNNVFLVVNGQFRITGQFMDRNGARIGNSFTAVPSVATIASRVAYAPGADVFLVTFVDESNPKNHIIGGRLIRFGTGGVPQFLSGEFVINQNGIPKHLESAPSVAWSPESNEFLVTWAEYAQGGGPDVKAQRVGANGELKGGPINISTTGAWEGLPAVAYNSAWDEFAVVLMYEVGNAQYSRIVRVKAGTGDVVGANNLYGSAGLNNYPEIAYDSRRNQYMVITWYITKSGGADVWGSFADASLNPVGNLMPVAAQPWFEGGDGIGLSYNSGADAYLAAFQGPSKDTLATGVTGAGDIQLEFRAMVTGAVSDIFQPQIAADHGQAQWFIASSVDFNRVMGQVIGVVGGGNNGGGGGDGGGGQPSATIELTSQSAPNGSWFFAEGATGGGAKFDSYFLIENPNAEAVTVTGYFARSTDGYTIEKNFDVAPLKRETIRLADQVGEGSYGVVFKSTTPGKDVFVERSVYWGSTWGEGGAASAGEHDLQTTWYFAEGSLKGGGFFQNYFLVFNPSNDQTAHVTVTFYLQDGQGAPVTREFDIAPRARLTLLANTISDLANKDFATTIAADIPIAAERSMYWGNGWHGGTNSTGAPNPATTWYFAEGAAAPNFDTYITILNPNGFDVVVDVTYLGTNGQIGDIRTYTIARNSRATLWLTGEVGLAGAVGTRIVARNGADVVCERSTYWGNGQWVEGSNAVGVTQLAPVWHLPEGVTINGFDTFVLVSNPNPFPVKVRLWAIRDNGDRVYGDDPIIPANGRETIWVNNDSRFEAVKSTTFSVLVETLTPGAGVIAEHAIYWLRDGANYWRGGSAAFGIPRPE